MALQPIRALVENDLTATDHFIRTELHSEIPLVNELVDHILSSGGKRIRPLLVLLSARVLDHRSQESISLAATIELIHTATLLHDDVVDHAALRRGQETANSLWGNPASVLVGDYLYSRAFQWIARLKNPVILSILADATNLIAEGEILQLINSRNPHATEAAYFDVIKRKTAKLFEVASQIGTALASPTATQMTAMQTYGMHLGIAYQLIDDALDYNLSERQTGKELGNDLVEGKPTLPLIHALQKGSKAETALLQDALKNRSTESLDQLINIIISTGAIDYTIETAKHHAKKANQSLTFIPDSPYRNALQDLSAFVVERNY